jgi:hypothetical protein
LFLEGPRTMAKERGYVKARASPRSGLRPHAGAVGLLGLLNPRTARLRSLRTAQPAGRARNDDRPRKPGVRVTARLAELWRDGC